MRIAATVLFFAVSGATFAPGQTPPAAAARQAHAAPPVKAAPPQTPQRRYAQTILSSLPLRDRVAQLVIGVVYGDIPSAQSKDGEKYRHWIRDLHIGGLIVNNRVQYGLVRNAEPHAMALFLNEAQRMSRLPLLVGGDFERGASMRVSDTTKFPHNMAFAAARDVEASRLAGRMAARQARTLGVQWVFAPVTDVNNNPDNPVINIRSFGENPEQVAEHVTAFIEGAHSDPLYPVILSAKHFPGHGDTGIDSHLDLARLDADRDRMNDVELAPFRAAIASGVDTIMTAHITVPAYEPNSIPATVSRNVLTGLLRNDLGFSGMIVTDAMDMLGLVKLFPNGDASVRAIEAGADILLMPADPDAAIDSVVAAVRKGRIPLQRINTSAIKILEAKVRTGLFRSRFVDLTKISDVLDSPEETDLAQSVADRAVTLVRNQANVVPLSAPANACVIASIGVRLSSYGQRMAEEFRRRAPGTRFVFVDSTMNAAMLDAAAGDVNSCSAVVFASFTVNPALNGEIGPFLERLSAQKSPVIFVSFGNPYLIRNYPAVAAYLATFTPTIPSEIAVTKALLGEMPITGKLPVTIPGIAEFGDGLTTGSPEAK